MSDNLKAREHRVLRASVYVWIFIALYAAILPVQRILGSFDMSQLTVAFGLVIGAYIGVDGWAGIMKTGTLPTGTKYPNNRAKLEAIVIATMVLVLEGVLLQYVLMDNPEMGIQYYTLPITDLVTMSAGCTAVFIGVEKGKTVAEGRGPK